MKRKLVLEPRTYCKIQGSDKEMQRLKNAESWQSWKQPGDTK